MFTTLVFIIFIIMDNNIILLIQPIMLREDRIPETVSIKHNAFTSTDDMKVKVKYDRNIAIPIIYGVVTAILFVLFLIYRQSYKDELVLEQSKSSVKNMDDEIPLEEMEVVASQEEKNI